MKDYIKKLYISLGQFRLLYLLSVLELAIIVGWSVYSGEGMNVEHDTMSYYYSYEHELTMGMIGKSRTPLFPLIIGLAKDIFGMTVSVAMVYIFQSIVFLFSINWLGTTLCNITSHKKIAYWFTSIYALYPGVLTYCAVMMTESLSISLVAAALYYASEAYYHASYKKAAVSGFVCMLLWMQRPSLVIVPLLLVVMWMLLIMFERKSKLKIALWGLASTLISLGGLWIYSIVYNSTYNKSGISAVPTWNNYMFIREAKIIDTAAIKSPQIKEVVDSFIRVNGVDGPGMVWWSEVEYLYTHFELSDFDDFVTCQMKNNPKGLSQLLYHNRMEYLLDAYCVNYGYGIPPGINSFMRFLRINNGTAFLIFLAGLVILIYGDVENRRFRYFIWMLFVLFAADYLMVWVGAPGEYTRLLAQNYPVLIAVSCWLLDQLTKYASSGRDEQY